MEGFLLKAARRMAKALLTVACCPSAAALLTVLLGSFLQAWEGSRFKQGVGVRSGRRKQVEWNT